MTRDYLDTFETFPIDPVLIYLGEVPDERGRYWCPWHDDKLTGKPSADVWGDEEDMLGCWSCGARGDAIDVVMALKGWDRQRALTEIREALENFTPKTRRQRPAPDADKLEAELRRLTTGVRYPHDVNPLDRWAQTRELPAREYLETWGWVGDYRGRVVMPHRMYDGTLTGLRFRVPPKWEKDGRKRSRFKQLYGGWRLPEVSSSRNGDPLEEIWLCEGETDSAWCGWHLEPFGVASVGLPTASYLPVERDLELFRGRRTVMVLDPGEAGQLATERWADAIEPVAAELHVLRWRDSRDLSQRNPIEIRERLQ